jgi:prepilin-type processing-associated H-X9-DG protein
MVDSMKTQRTRAALTLVEVLIVIAILGTLFLLLTPAMVPPGSPARQSICLNNLRNLGYAMVNFEKANQHYPGYTQLIQRDETRWVTLRDIDGRIVIDNATSPKPSTIPNNAHGISWAAMLLPYLERQDLWDRLVDVNSTSGHNEMVIVASELFICPSDSNATAEHDLPALSYSANTGAWDLDATGPAAKFLFPPGKGDTTDNGLFCNRVAYQHAAATRPDVKPPTMRFAKIRDGASQTIMLSENCNKDYRPVGTGASALRFTWLGGGDQSSGNPVFGTEQQLGIVWVVNPDPQPAPPTDVTSQERINHDAVGDATAWNSQQTVYARPSSMHQLGVNVIFADGHCTFLRDDIDYSVYQQLMTPNGRKCVDPRDWNDLSVIDRFRKTPILTSSDYE